MRLRRVATSPLSGRFMSSPRQMEDRYGDSSQLLCLRRGWPSDDVREEEGAHELHHALPWAAGSALAAVTEPVTVVLAKSVPSALTGELSGDRPLRRHWNDGCIPPRRTLKHKEKSHARNQVPEHAGA